MNSPLRLDADIEEVNRKISWLIVRLTSARLIKDLWFNLNLYNVLSSPLESLCILVYLKRTKENTRVTIER
jgi:hypothetical protein